MARFVRLKDDKFINVDNIIKAELQRKSDKSYCIFIHTTDDKDSVVYYDDKEQCEEIFYQIVYGVSHYKMRQEIDKKLKESEHKWKPMTTKDFYNMLFGNKEIK